MFQARLDDVTDQIDAMLQGITLDTMAKVEILLQAVGAETIAYLRSLTSNTRPPVRAGEGSRYAHPGGWADVTGNLANAYAFAVEKGSDSISLVLSNSMSYAAILEARDGFFVLSGVTDPGGPVQTSLERALARIAPDMELRYE